MGDDGVGPVDVDVIERPRRPALGTPGQRAHNGAGWRPTSERNGDARLMYMRAPDGTITSTRDVAEWNRWMSLPAERTRRIAEDAVPRRRGWLRRPRSDLWVVTAFLGLDHSFGRGGDPILFETTVFCGQGGDELFTARYSDEVDAHLEHIAVVHALRQGRPPGHYVSKRAL